MILHITKRGAAALAWLKAYEGIPLPYDKGVEASEGTQVLSDGNTMIPSEM
ncbi:hypothetical protein CDL15_Pgr020129 [Punica granatum]|nr:hypothetical protein CDL15_Pgr020129 [Punica granatum]